MASRSAETRWASFSALPAISVQPTGSGVTVVARYITRAPEWRDVRSRLYSEIITLLGREKIPSESQRKLRFKASSHSGGASVILSKERWGAWRLSLV